MKVVVVFLTFVAAVYCLPTRAEGSCDISDGEIRGRFDSVENKIESKTDEIISMLQRHEKRNCRTEYVFNVTKTTGPFNEIRKICLDLGGDLIQDNLGPSGANYHDQIRGLREEVFQLMKSNPGGGKDVWIGYTDAVQEGDWKLLNGKELNARNHDNVFYWIDSEPNSGNGNEDCAAIGYFWSDSYVGNNRLIDLPCGRSQYGLCERKVSTCD